MSSVRLEALLAGIDLLATAGTAGLLVYWLIAHRLSGRGEHGSDLRRSRRRATRPPGWLGLTSGVLDAAIGRWLAEIRWRLLDLACDLFTLWEHTVFFLAWILLLWGTNWVIAWVPDHGFESWVRRALQIIFATTTLGLAVITTWQRLHDRLTHLRRRGRRRKK